MLDELAEKLQNIGSEPKLSVFESIIGVGRFHIYNFQPIAAICQIGKDMTPRFANHCEKNCRRYNSPYCLERRGKRTAHLKEKK